MTEFLEYLSDIFSLSNVISFALGSISMYAFIRIRDWRLDVTDPANAPHQTKFKRMYLSIGFVILMIIFILVRTQMASNNADEALERAEAVSLAAQQMAQDNRECYTQFNLAVRANATARDREIELSDREQKALSKLFFDLLAIDPTLPREVRDQQGQVIFKAYTEELRITQAERDANEQYRKENPYPLPTCGN